jgi:ankyrin repeat protein
MQGITKSTQSDLETGSSNGGEQLKRTKGPDKGPAVAKPLALPSAQQVLAEQATGGPLTVNQAEYVNKIAPHFLSLLEIKNLNPAPPFVPQLNVVGGLNASDQNQPEGDQIKAIISSVLPDIEKPIMNQYLHRFKEFPPDQQRCLITMFFQVKEAYSETNDETIKTLLTSVVTEPVCFIGQKNTLMQILESRQMTSKTDAPFERKLNSMIISVITKLEQDILRDINAGIFYNAPDPQSSHQLEPVRVWLDKNLGLYDGRYPEDIYNHTTPVVNQIIAESFQRVGGNYRLTLDFWVKTISKEINQHPEECIMLCDYINQIVTKPELSKHFSESFIHELKDELNERAQTVDTLLFEKDDFELILEKYDKGNQVFYPSDRFIRELLSVNLNQKNRARLSETTSGNQQTEGRESFCLRHGIKESVIKAAHGTRETVIKTIKDLPARWSLEETALFFHIISQKYPDIRNGIKFSEEEKTKLTNRLNEQNKNGKTIVHIAAQNGQADAICMLADKGADVNARDSDGATPMHYSAFYGHANAIRMLADKGADVNKPMEDSRTPMHIAAHNGHVEAIRMLAGKGAKVNIANNNGETPMHFAAHKGHVEAIRVLADKRANVNAQDSDGETPMHVAAYYGHANAIRVLKDWGADVNKPMKDGRTPMHVAAKNGQVDAIRVLTDKGADVNKPMEDGRTPVFIAAQNGQVDAIRVLTDKGADVNIAMKNGATPMHVAAHNGYVEAIQVLADKGADVNKPMKDGRTPVFIAAQNGQADAIRVLAELKANVNIALEDGATPMDVAAKNGHVEAIRVLKELRARTSSRCSISYRCSIS